MTDPIGTAQERYLIKRLRLQSQEMREVDTLVHLALHDAADALQSRIAEVVELRDALVDARAVLAHGSSQSARFLLGKIDAALSLQRRV